MEKEKVSSGQCKQVSDVSNGFYQDKKEMVQKNPGILFTFLTVNLLPYHPANVLLAAILITTIVLNVLMMYTS